MGKKPLVQVNVAAEEFIAVSKGKKEKEKKERKKKERKMEVRKEEQENGSKCNKEINKD